MHKIYWEGRRAIKIFSGHVTGAEFRQSIDQFTEALDFDSCRGLLIDALGVTSHEVAVTDLQYLAVMRIGTRSINPAIPVAIVTGHASDFLLNALEEPDMRGTGEVAYFRSIEEASRWLSSRHPRSSTWA